MLFKPPLLLDILLRSNLKLKFFASKQVNSFVINPLRASDEINKVFLLPGRKNDFVLICQSRTCKIWEETSSCQTRTCQFF